VPTITVRIVEPIATISTSTMNRTKGYDRTVNNVQTDHSLQDLIFWQQQAEAMINDVAQASHRSSSYLNYDPTDDSTNFSESMHNSMATLDEERVAVVDSNAKMAEKKSVLETSVEKTPVKKTEEKPVEELEKTPVEKPVEIPTKKTVVKMVEKVAKDKDSESSILELLDLNPFRSAPFDEEAFLSMIQEQPELVQRKYKFKAFNNAQLYPLHVLCTLHASSKCVRACYKAHPEAAIDSHVGTPLHFAATCNGIPEVVHLLAKRNRSLLTVTNRNGKTPLHLACEHGAHPKTVMELTSRGPTACDKKDKEGRTPLHCACAVARPNAEVVEDLLATQPEACEVRDKHGNTPLLIALQNTKCSMEVVRLVVVANPKGAALRNTMDGSMATALNVALTLRSQDVTAQVLKDLIRAYPKALQMKDGQGRIPLHAALDSGADDAVCMALVKKWSTAVEVRNKRGEIPHAAAIRLKREKSLIEFLYPYEED